MFRSLYLRNSAVVVCCGVWGLRSGNISSCQHQSSPSTPLKKLAGYKAVDDFVASGMTVALGSGSTAYFAIERIGQLLATGQLTDIIAVPTSDFSKKHATSVGIPVGTLNNNYPLDLMIDGANEVDDKLNIIKGGSGCILREKMAASAALKYICVVDESKLSSGLGPGHPIAVEIVPYGYKFTQYCLQYLPSAIGCKAVLRKGSPSSAFPDGLELAVTDDGNYIVDLYFEKPIEDIGQVRKEIDATAGVVNHGILERSPGTTVLVAGKDGCHVAHILEEAAAVAVAGNALEIKIQQGAAQRREKPLPILSPEQVEEVIPVAPWWGSMKEKVPMERLTVDNRQIN